MEQRLVLPDHEELRQHAGAAIAKHNRRGWRLDKANRRERRASAGTARRPSAPG